MKLFRSHVLPLAMAITLANLHAGAQSYLVSEDFGQFPSGGAVLPFNGWENNVISGSSTVDQWVFDNPASRITNSPISGKFAIFDSDWNSQNAMAEDVALESPAFSGIGHQKIILRFDQYFDGIYNTGDSIVVEIFDGNHWDRVFSYSGTVAFASSELIDITGLVAGSANAKVRFRFVGNWSYFWIVDNIRVIGYYDYDASVSGVRFTSDICGATNDSIEVEVTNGGLTTISGFTVSADISGSLGGNNFSNTVSAVYSGILGPGASGTIKLGSVNTALGGSVHVLAWTSLTGEEYPDNDSARIAEAFLGVPGTLSVANGSRCGQGSVTLHAQGADPSDSVFWFNSSQSQAPLALGPSFNTPVTGPGTFNYFVSSGRGRLNTSITTTFTGINGHSGVMFDLHAVRTLVIDSFEVNMDPGTHLVQVYYRAGSYQGYESNASAWTLLGTSTVTSVANPVGQGTMVKVGSMLLPQGSDYAFYIQLPNATAINYSNGGMTINGDHLILSAGVGKGPNFGATFSPRSFNGRIHFNLFPLCEGPRQLAQVLVRPRTSGSALLKGTLFKGQYNDGSLTNPHVVAKSDTISFEIQAPSGTNNNGFGTDWKILAIDCQTLGGTGIGAGDTFLVAPLNGKNVTLLFTPSGAFEDSTYVIRFTVRSMQSGCDTFMENFVYVAPRPNALFSASSVCYGDTVNFINQSSILSGTLYYEWDFGNGKTSTHVNPAHVYLTPGAYHVSLKVVSGYGYASTYAKLITVKPKPQADFDFMNSCDGNPVGLTNASSVPAGTVKLLWDLGNGDKDTGASLQYLYGSSGSYKVTLRVEVNSCVSEKSKWVTQAPRAIPSFQAQTSCNNIAVPFQNQSTLSSGTMGYRWDFGDGTSSSQAQPTHKYTGSGQFLVTLTVFTDLGCSDSVSKYIQLLEAPRAAFTFSTPCVGEVIHFTNASAEPQNFYTWYTWLFENGISSNVKSPAYVYTGAGEFTVKLHLHSSNHCSDSLVQKLVVNEKPVAGIVAPYVSCDGEVIDIRNATASSKPHLLTYNWDYGNGSSGHGLDTNIVFPEPGVYKIRLKAFMPGGCSDSASHNVRIAPVPSADFTVESKQTGDGSFSFKALEASSAVAYQWFFGDGEKSNQVAPDYTYPGDGLYTVKLVTRNSDYCIDEKTYDLSVYRTGLKEQIPLNTGLLYPSPNQGEFTIRLPEGGELTRVEVVTSLGQQTGISWTLSGTGEVMVSMDMPSPGTYFVRMSFKGHEPLLVPFIVVK